MKTVDVNEIIKKLEKCIDYYGNKCFLREDKDDIKQKMRIRIMKATDNYNKNLSEYAYFRKIIVNEMYRIYKTETKKKIQLHNIIDEYGEMTMTRHSFSPDHDIMKSENKKLFKMMVEHAKNALNERALKTYNFLIDGLDNIEISKILKISPTKVYHIKAEEIRPIFQNAIKFYRENYGLSV